MAYEGEGMARRRRLNDTWARNLPRGRYLYLQTCKQEMGKKSCTSRLFQLIRCNVICPAAKASKGNCRTQFMLHLQLILSVCKQLNTFIVSSRRSTHPPPVHSMSSKLKGKSRKNTDNSDFTIDKTGMIMDEARLMREWIRNRQ